MSRGRGCAMLLLGRTAIAGTMLAGKYLLHHRPRGLPSPRQNPLPSLRAAHDAQPPVQLPLRICPPPCIHLQAVINDALLQKVGVG